MSGSDYEPVHVHFSHRLILLTFIACALLPGLACSSSSGHGGEQKGGGSGGNGSGSGGSGMGNGDGGSGTVASGGTTGPDDGNNPVNACVPQAKPLPALPPQSGSCPQAPGMLSFETAEFCVSLDPGSQTITSLRPKTDPSFDYAPSDRLNARSGDGFSQLGDINLRIKTTDQTSYSNISSSAARQSVTALDSSDGALAAADITPTLAGSPLVVTRQWTVVDGRLALRFLLENQGTQTIEVGGLGIPLVFNNIITGRSLEEAHERCSFVDPYIGNDAGYAQVTRLSGDGAALLILPETGTPLEAYGQLLNSKLPDSQDPEPIFLDKTPRNQTFEGFHEWLVHSSAYAAKEWAGVEPWNPPTSVILEPGASRSYGLRFVLSESIREIESTVLREQRPLAVGVPGYIVPTDLEAKLFIHYPSKIERISVFPQGALEWKENDATEGCYRAFTVRGKTWGRARLTLDYEDGTSQTVHYTVTKAAKEVVSDMGKFLTSKAWFDEPDDPFGRSPSVMTYDREDGIVTQSKQAWVCGLGDDGGATWLAGIMKLGGQPVLDQVQKYEEFVDGVVWGGLQYSQGSLKFGVKRTLFYYEPNSFPVGYYDAAIDWTTWASWSKAHTEQVPRSYNYPHVAALYWTLYRLARNTSGLVSHHPWDWYLRQAYETSVAMTTVGNQYAEFGVMDGSVFLEILKDLQHEEWAAEANNLETRMKARADHWATLAFPFGSEMAWDSTGQEEVYVWSKYFGRDDKAKVTLDAILGYMPTVPHWGYNGSARRYWDFIYGGAKISRLERMLHHYGSSLNAIPVLSEYRDKPDDFYLLRIGYGGMMGPLSNIDQEGFPSMAFHSFADTLKWDARTGDYGLAFYGHAANTGTYLTKHPEFGWLAFGGNVTESGETISITPLDSMRKRIYLAPLGLWLTLDSGEFERIELNPISGAISIEFAAADTHTTSARLRIEQPGAAEGTAAPTPLQPITQERGAWLVPLTSTVTSLELAEQGRLLEP